MTAYSFSFFVALLALLAIVGVSCKPVAKKSYADTPGVYIVNGPRVYDGSAQLDMRDTLSWNLPEYSGSVGLQVTDKVLTLGAARQTGRCVRCHECGFPAVWDIENYETPEWAPKYIGEEWAPSIQRMRLMENSILNEKIADRIYEFLRLETLGEYDESKDDKGAFVIQR